MYGTSQWFQLMMLQFSRRRWTISMSCSCRHRISSVMIWCTTAAAAAALCLELFKINFQNCTPRAGSGVVRIHPLWFLAGCPTRRLNQAYSVCHILACIMLYCCLLGPLLFDISFRWYVFCLLVDLDKLSLLAKLFTRKTPLRKPNRGDGIVSIKPRPKRAYDCVGSLYSFIV